MALEEYEAASGITFSIDGIEIPIASVDTTKDVTIEEIRGNNLKPIGFSITEISFSGTLTFEGNGYIDEIDGVTNNTDQNSTVDDISATHLEDFFTDESGKPVDGAVITVYHDNDAKQTSYEDVMVSSDGYETETGEVSGITFEFIAADRDRNTVDSDE